MCSAGDDPSTYGDTGREESSGGDGDHVRYSRPVSTPDRADRASAEGLRDIEWLVWFARKSKGTVEEVARRAIEQNPYLRDHSDSGDIDVERLDRAIEAFYGRRLPRTSAEGIAREYARASTPESEHVYYCQTCGKTRMVEWLHRECPPDARASTPESEDIAQRLDEAHARGFREGYRTAAARATPDRADPVEAPWYGPGHHRHERFEHEHEDKLRHVHMFTYRDATPDPYNTIDPIDGGRNDR